MEITTSLHQAKASVALMKIAGEINASNYVQVVRKAQDLFNHPSPYLVIDLSEVTSITSAGIVGLHQISLIFSGIALEMDLEGEDARIDDTHSNKARKYVKLLSPQPGVYNALQDSGMKLFFTIFTDLDAALNSF